MKKENSFFVITAFIALALSVFIRHDELYRVPLYVYVGILIIIVVGNVIGIVTKKNKEALLLWNFCSIGFLATLIAVRTAHIIQMQALGNNKIAGGISIIAIVLLAFTVIITLKLFRDEENIVFLLMFWAFLIRVFFVVLAQANYFQNDLGIFKENDYGHLGYIYYLFENKSLPDEYRYQYYHPPLHHIISAMVFKLCEALGVAREHWDEILQCLSLYYGTATIGFLNKISIKLGYSGKSRLVALGLASFIPYSIMMSGALNNDGLMALLAIMFIYYLICWYKEPKVNSIIAMALCMGGAMMTKFSAVLIAPAAAVVMLIKAYKERKIWGKYLKQFAIFGIIVFPLGLWHSIRNCVKFNLPLGYVTRIGEDQAQYIGMFGLKQRFLDFSAQFEPLHLNWVNTEANVSHNIPVSLVKYATFGESRYYLNSPVLEVVGTIMFWMTAVVFILLLTGFIIWMLQKHNQSIWKLFILLAVATISLFYIVFCFDYPFVCTMSVRYIMIAVFLECLVAGVVFAPECNKDNACTKRGALSLVYTSLFAYIIGCNILMLNLGFWL